MLEIMKQAVMLYSPRHWPVFQEMLEELAENASANDVAQVIVDACRKCNINEQDFPNIFENKAEREEWKAAYEKALGLTERIEAMPGLPDFEEFKNKEAIEQWALDTLGVNIDTSKTREAMIEEAKAIFEEQYG